MKVSEISVNNLVEYLRLSTEELTKQETDQLNALLTAAKEFILSYTGINAENLDEHEDFVIAVYILVQDMHDNRTLYIDRKNLNYVVQTILNMHSINLL